MEDATEHTLKSFMFGNKLNQQQDGATADDTTLLPLVRDKSLSVLTNVESGTTLTLDADEMNRLRIKCFYAVAFEEDIRALQDILKRLPTFVVAKQLVNLRNLQNGESCLHYASHYERYDAVKILLDYGADVDITDNDGDTPLHYIAQSQRAAPLKLDQEQATVKGHIEITRLLIAYGANVNIKNKAKLTPLQSATMCGNATVMCILWDNNATDKNVRNRREMTLLHLASVYGSESVCQFILEKSSSSSSLRETDCRGWNALHFAAWNGRTSIAEMLLKKTTEMDASFGSESARGGAQKFVNSANNEGKIPLHLATACGSYEIVKLLIDYGSDVNAVDTVLQETPLHAACLSNNFRIIKLLLDRGANVDHLNSAYKTPLHRACRYCEDPNVVEALVIHRAMIEARDRFGLTPLLVAAHYGRKRLFEYLFEHGADVEAVDREDCNVLHVCASYNQIEILQFVSEKLTEPVKRRLMVQPDGYSNTALHNSALEGFLGICELLLFHGAPITLKNYEGQTPLHLAAAMGRLSIVKSMLNHCREHGFGNLVNDEDENGNTPMHLAATKRHYHLIPLLYQDGARLLIKNLESKTALECAAECGWSKSVRSFFELDVLHIHRDSFKTCMSESLRLACQNGHLEVVKVLLEKDAATDYREIPFVKPNYLDVATSADRRDVAMAIINSGSWSKALSSCSGHRHGIHQTPLRNLIRMLPDVTCRAFDRCITIVRERVDGKEKKWLCFNFEFVDDTFALWNFSNAQGKAEPYDSSGKLLSNAKPYSSSPDVVKRNHPFMTMVFYEREELLSHPLVRTLLDYKWSHHGRIVYNILLGFYCIYVFFLTAFVLSTPPPYKVNAEKYGHPGDKEISGLASANNNTSDDNDECSRRARAYDDEQRPKSFCIFCKYAVLALVLFNVAREFVEMTKRRRRYLKYENVIEWTMYCSVFVMVVDFTKCASQSGIREDWQWQFGCVGLFLSWINLALFFRKLHRLGIYIVMFTSVTKTFCKFFIVLFLFMCAFAMAFYGLLQNQYPFRDIASSILKTTTMMIGEFSFDEIFNAQSASGDDNNSDSHSLLYYAILTRLLFFLFVCIMTIIVMNLLIGLAVDDIKSVMEQATLKKLAMQAELVLDVETMIPDVVRNFMIRRGCFVKYLKFDVDKIDFRSDSNLYKAKLIAESNNSDNSRQEELQQLKKSQDIIRRRTKDSLGRIRRIENIVQSLAQKHEVTWEEPED